MLTKPGLVLCGLKLMCCVADVDLDSSCLAASNVVVDLVSKFGEIVKLC